MTDDERLAELLRVAFPRTPDKTPSRDLWPLITTRDDSHRLSWIDVGIAAAVATSLVMVPEWFWLLAFHL